jgi:hypothetical protein
VTAVMEDQAGWFTEDGDTAYLGKVLRHQPMELSLDDRVPALLVFFIWLRAAIVGWIVGGLGAYVLSRKISGDNADAVYGTSASGVTIGEVFVYVALPGMIAFFLVFFLAKLNQAVGEWRVLLASRSQCADSVYSMIAGVIAQRQIPLEVKARRMLTGTGKTKRTWANRLIIQEGTYTAYVTVFSYGTSLYLSWSMWRRRSGWALFKRMFGDMFGANIVKVMLRMDRPRAMREAVHSACREGLKVAVTNTVVPVEFGFANGLPPIADLGAPAVRNSPSTTKSAATKKSSASAKSAAARRAAVPPAPSIPAAPPIPQAVPVQSAPPIPAPISAPVAEPFAAVVDVVPEPVSEPVLEPVLEYVPEAVPETVPETIPGSAEQSAVESVPSPFETAGSDGAAAW